MRAKRILYLLLSCATCLACSGARTQIVWTEGETDPETGKTVHTLEILHAPAGADWTLWFSQFRTPVTMAPEAPASIEHVSGTLYRVAPAAGCPGGDLVLRYEARALVNQCRAPEGFFLPEKGKQISPAI